MINLRKTKMDKQKDKVAPSRSIGSYPFAEIESKWQKRWDEQKLFRAPDFPTNPYYVLVMFAYPSGDIHMGHFRNYIVGDAIARWKMMQGHQVLHPFGWDAFGLPAEQAAIKRKLHPRDWTLNNIEMSRDTLKKVGISFDWDREVASCLPDYYKWTQWMFIKLFENGLAYRKEASVNWCSTCNTVLANEQVDSEGRCWRCEGTVTKKKLEQWFFKITAYAERLYRDIDTLPGWLESVRMMQRNWIGRSEGCRIDFTIAETGERLPIFTTRPDTVFGVTFMAIAPESDTVSRLPIPESKKAEIAAYIQRSISKSELERTMGSDEKDGVFTGCYATNPFSGEKVQLWIADYVLASYGSGTVMGVPAHDQRDFLFAKKYGIPLRVVIHPQGGQLQGSELQQAYADFGVMVNSAGFDGKAGEDAITAVTDYAAAHGIGGREINYRLRDWLVSRQRYWGCPIPIIHCPHCGPVAERIDNLPVMLPDVKDYIPKGRSPLADVPEYTNVRCPKCGGSAERDPDTMDTFVCSSWYLFRYTDSKNSEQPFAPEKAKAWLPVDIYIGGTHEHATGHLLYYRFFTKFLKDIGYLTIDEPAVRLLNHGMVLDAIGTPMSKSAGNVVSPLDVMASKGVDTTRLAMHFAAPCGKEVLWSEDGIVGVDRLVQRMYRLALVHSRDHGTREQTSYKRSDVNEETWKTYVRLNQTVKKVTEDLDKLQFNTCIAAIMEFLNDLGELDGSVPRFHAFAIQKLTQLLAPLTPHLSEEIWEMFGHAESVFKSHWPDHDSEAIEDDSITIAIQINGKLRATITVPRGSQPQLVAATARAIEPVQKHLQGREILKEIIVPGKLVNFVVR